MEDKSENRILFHYEKRMGSEVFDQGLRMKYLQYLHAYAQKGHMTTSEYRERKKKFVKAQNKARKTYGIK